MLVLPKHLSSVETLAFLSGGRLLVAGNKTKKVFVYDLDDPSRPPAAHPHDPRDVPIVVPLPTDDTFLLSDFATVRVVHPRAGDRGLLQGRAAYEITAGVAYHPTARLAAVVYSHQIDHEPLGSLYRLDARYLHRPTFVKHLPAGTLGRVCLACAFDATGTHLFVADTTSDPGSDRLVRIPVRRRGRSRQWRHPPPGVEQLLVDPVAGHLVARGRGGVSVYPNGTWDWPPIRLLDAGRRKVTGLAFHPSGRWLAATSNDATVKLFDTTSWAAATTFTWDVGRMRSVAFSPDGTLAAAGSDSGKVVVWDVDV